MPVDVDKDVAVLPFSSGTTGVPKGVMLSQKNLVDYKIIFDHMIELLKNLIASNVEYCDTHHATWDR